MPVTIDYRVQTAEYESRIAWLSDGKRRIPGLRWADVLHTIHELHGLPVRFHTQDFLTSMTFWIGQDGSELTVVFCSQGRRRGEVILSIPATADAAAALMQQLGNAIEARRAAIRQAAIASGIPAEYFDAEPEEEEYYDD